MAKRMAVMVGAVVTMAGWGRVALAQPCTPAECMTNGMCTIDGECEGTPVSGGGCDDFDSCTINDTCVNGICMGIPTSVGTCDDGNPCTTNDRCMNGMCVGTPASNGSPCGDAGCQGTCVGAAGLLFCVLNPAVQNQPCTDQFGNCTTNDRCLGFSCFGTPVLCPDVDQNPCTIEFCNFQIGQCENTSFDPCGECQTCDTDTGDCIPGVSPGTPTATRTGGAATPTATRTVDPATPSATPVSVTATATLPAATPTRPQPGPCVADCNDDGRVSVDEVVLATQIALGVALLDDCQAADFDQNQQVTVDELLLAVQALLGGCQT